MIGDAERDRGATAVESAVVFPAMLLVIILFFQFGLVAYAHHVVVNAAQDAAAGAALGDRPDADRLLSSIRGFSSDAGVSVSSDGSDRVYSQSQASVMSLVPGLPRITVRGSGSATVERFRPEGR